MLTKTSVMVARDLAASLTERGIILGVKEGGQTPLSIMSNHYETGAPGLRRQLSDASIQKLSNQFFENNQTEGENTISEERDKLIQLIVSGQRNLLYKVRQEIIPKCKKIHARMEDVNTRSLPDIEVKKVVICPFLENPGFINHVSRYPSKHRLENEYRTFHLDYVDTEVLMDWVSKTPHFNEEAVRAWALESFTSEDIRCVFMEMFEGVRSVNPNEFTFTKRSRMFANSNQLVAAYFLTAYLHDHPQPVKSESVDLEEWQQVLTKLHALFGLKILELLKIRQDYLKRGRVVVDYSVHTSKYGSATIHVHVNNDVFPGWMEQGGDIKILLGAALNSPNSFHISDFKGHEEALVKYWDRKHATIKAQRHYQSGREIRDSLFHNIKDEFKSDDSSVFKPLRDAINRVSDSDLDNMWKVIFDLVCEIYYPKPIYRQFLDAMNAHSRTTPDLREAALLADIEILALWFRSMVTYDKFEADVVNDKGENEEHISDPQEVAPESA